MTERKGFFTPEQEDKLDDLIVLKGLAETLDGPAIKLLDNQGLERLKAKLVEVGGQESLEIAYQVMDTLLAIFPNPK